MKDSNNIQIANFYQQMEYSDSKIKQLIHSGNYEKYVLELMNLSKRIFPNHYSYNELQLNGECDFIDTISGYKYDAKLPFNSKQGKMLGSRNGEITEWIRSMCSFQYEFANCLHTGKGFIGIENIGLYKVMRDNLNRIDNDERAVFFFPFPIVDDYDSVFRQFASDELSVIFDTLKKNGYVKNDVFCIYPSIDKLIVLRNLENFTKEFVKYNKLKEFFDFTVRVIS